MQDSFTEMVVQNSGEVEKRNKEMCEYLTLSRE